MMFKKELLIITFILAFSSAKPQDSFDFFLTTDTIPLDEVIISANRLANFSTGIKVTQTSPETIKAYSTQSLADLLSQQSQINIKSYGNSGIANASTRGSGSNHTAVLWNGFNLQDAMNGGVNLNEIPVNFIDEVYIQQGGSGALFGSGALGGVIHFNTNPKFDNPLNIGICQKYGSYNHLFNGLNISYGSQRFSSTTRIFQQSAENNYDFQNTTVINKPIQKVTNASFSKWGIQQSFGYKLNPNQQFNANVWYHDAFNEIPDMMIIVGSAEQSQSDKALRATLEWNRTGEISSTAIRSAYFDNQSLYENPSIDEKTHNNFKTTINEIEQRIQLGSNHLINAGINNTYESGFSDYYSGEKNRNRISLFSSYKIFNHSNTLSATASIRNEFVDAHSNPITYSLGTQARILSWLQITSNFSKNYRLPTFNELYWANWGNPDLDPEWGYNVDLGLNANKNFKNYEIGTNISYYNSNVTNWIIWVPERTIWTPKNVKEVWLRGIESNLILKVILHDFTIKFNINYNYSKATNEGENASTQVQHQQIIYVPLHQINYTFEASYRFIRVSFNQYGASKRYTSENNIEFVDSYNVANLNLSFMFKVHKLENLISFAVYNINNTEYQVMAWYPMPLRHYALSYKININPNN